MGKGGGSSTTSTELPQWLQKNLQDVYSRANTLSQQPLSQYSAPLVAGFTPAQNAAFNTINNAQGSYAPYLNTASQYTAKSAAPISSNQIQQYQNPYTQQVVDATQAQLNQNNAIQQQDLLGKAIQSGASPFGGDRAGVAAATLANQQKLADNQTIANLYSQGYSQALGQANADAARQASAGQTFAGYGQQALNDALTAANAQLSAGTTQQQLAQQQLNIPYQQFQQQQAYPYQQLGVLEQATGLAGGLAGGTSRTTTNYAEGGVVGVLNASASMPHYADGGFGIPDISQGYIPQSQYTMQGSNISHLNAPQGGNVPRPESPLQQGADAAKTVSGAKDLYKTAKSGVEDVKSWFGDSAAGAGKGILDASTHMAAPIESVTASEIAPAAEGAVSAALPEAATTAGEGILGTLGPIGLGLAVGIPLISRLFGHHASGGIAHFADGGSGTGSGSNAVSFIPSASGIYTPQLNTEAFSGKDTSSQDYFNPLPQISNKAQSYQPVSINDPAAYQGYNTQGIADYLGVSNPTYGSSSSVYTPSITNTTGTQNTSAPDYSKVRNSIFSNLSDSQYGQLMQAFNIAPTMQANNFSPSVASQMMGYIQDRGWKKGGIAHFADGGIEAISDLPLESPTFIPKETPVKAYNEMPSTPDVQLQKDQMSRVNHSGDTAVVEHPSNGEKINTGIPSIKPMNTEGNIPERNLFGMGDTGTALLTGALSALTGTSKSPLVNLGRGALAGIGEYSAAREQAIKNAEEQNKQAWLQQYQTNAQNMEQQKIDFGKYIPVKDPLTGSMSLYDQENKTWVTPPDVYGAQKGNQSNNLFDVNHNPTSQSPTDYFGMMNPVERMNYENVVKKNQPKDLQNQQSTLNALYNSKVAVDDLAKQIPIASSGSFHKLTDFLDKNQIPVLSDPKRANATILQNYDSLVNTLNSIRSTFGGTGRVLQKEFESLQNELGAAKDASPEQKAAVVGKIQKKLNDAIAAQEQYTNDVSSGMAYLPSKIYKSPFQRQISNYISQSSGNNAAQSNFNEGDVAVNPKTGERMIRKGGRWVPSKNNISPLSRT